MLAEWNLGDALWAMLVFFFWFMAIWIFITIFADIFRRNDLSGWAKAGWIFLIFIVPFLGALIYVIARPKMTAQDKEMIEQAQEAQRRVEGYSPADEIAKLAALRDKGEISADEYNELVRADHDREEQEPPQRQVPEEQQQRGDDGAADHQRIAVCRHPGHRLGGLVATHGGHGRMPHIDGPPAQLDRPRVRAGDQGDKEHDR